MSGEFAIDRDHAQIGQGFFALYDYDPLMTITPETKIMTPHQPNRSDDLDAELIRQLKELGDRNDYAGYLDALNVALEKVVTVDNGEQLIPLTADSLGQRVHIRLVPIGIEANEMDRLHLRQALVEKIQSAAESLPPGYTLIVRDAFRTKKMVLDLYQLYINRLKNENPQLTERECDLRIRNLLAMPDDPVPPGHMTGGAVDIVLGDDTGERVNVEVSSDLIPRKDQATTFCPGLPQEIMERRLLLFNSLTQQGFHNYFKEYWHFSYGDAYWAVRRRYKNAIYGIPSRES